MRFKVAEFLGFQAVWLSCVAGAGAGLPWLGPLAGSVFLAVRAAFCRPAAPWLGLAAASAALGYVLDSALVLVGALAFPPHSALGEPSTVWMVTLWAAFAATLRGSFGWVRGRYALAVGLGGVFGPLSYLAGSGLGAVTFPQGGVFALVAVGAVWVLAMPLLVWLESRFPDAERA